MSNLITVPRNGNLAKKSSNYPSRSSWFDDFFLNDFPTVFSSNFNTGISLPKVNIKETSDDFVVEMAVPGLKKSDFKIDLDNYVLSISAEIEEDKEANDEGYTRREFGYASFKRTFTLPETIDEAKINASYNEGVLKIHLPKREEAKQKPARSIEIS
ncbi:Hsp20/alpha crystallin family protein [Mariniflexile ostreae]|uniref:Hsp20/alpha crystallin family protein n=1 Tax=Mariniflexile ostreae TaxID=1520892 RepID=A0ABV5F772_9FLAO